MLVGLCDTMVVRVDEGFLVEEDRLVLTGFEMAVGFFEDDVLTGL